MHALLIFQLWSLLRCQLHGQRWEQEADTGVNHLLEIRICRHAIRVTGFGLPTKASLVSDTLA